MIVKFFRIERAEWSPVLGYIALGLIMGHIGPVLSAASSELGFGSDRLGVLVWVFYGASVFGMLAGMFLAERVGKYRFILAGSIIFLVGYLVAAGAGSLSSLQLGLCISGFALGFYQVGVNTLAVASIAHLPMGAQPGRLSFLQFYFGVGAMMGPMMLEAVGFCGGNWSISFLLILVFGPAIFSVSIIRDMFWKGSCGRPIGGRASGQNTAHSEDVSHSPIRLALLIALMIVTISVYGSAEMASFTWLNFIWDANIGDSFWMSGAVASSVFWVVFSLSRLLMGKLIEHVGIRSFLLTNGAAFTLLSLIWGLLPDNGWVYLPIVILLALMFGCNFPTLMLIISRLKSGDSTVIVSILLATSTTVASFTSYLIGGFIKQFGAHSFPFVMFGMTALFLVLLATSFWMREWYDQSKG